jgi:hypothetical protein
MIELKGCLKNEFDCLSQNLEIKIAKSLKNLQNPVSSQPFVFNNYLQLVDWHEPLPA